MKKVLIIGGCGYLGARIAEYLGKKNYQISILDTFCPIGYNEWSSLIKDVIIGDIRDNKIIDGLINRNFDIVINLISLDHHQSNKEPNFVSSINVMPTWNILDSLSKNGLKKFIYFSTIHVYGKIPNQIISEDHPVSPINTYGLTHLLSEKICNYFNHNTNTECINIRLSNSYGSPVFNENNCWWLVLNDFCKSAFNNNEIKLHSDGSPQRDFIHSSDICSALELIIKVDTANNNIYHIASGKTFTILELAHIVKKIYEEVYKEKTRVTLIDNSLLENSKLIDGKKYKIDTSRINEIGFTPNMDISDGIKTIFNYLESYKNINLVK